MLESRLELHFFNRVFSIGTLVLTFVAFLIPILTLIFLATETISDNYWDEYHKKYGSNEMKGGKHSLNHEMHEELFHPDYQSLTIPLPHVKESLLFLDYNDRPDAKAEDASIVLGIEGVEGEKFVKEGEKIYFACEDENHFSFSKEPTPHWAEAKLGHDGSLDVTLHAQYLDINEKETIFHAANTFKVSESRKKELSDLNDPSMIEAIEQLKQAKCYSPDQLFALYGGESYHKRAECYRIAIPCTGGQEVHFLKEEDLLIFDNGCWKKAVGEETLGKPLLQIERVEGRKCHCTIWCGQGITSADLTIPLEFSNNLSISMHEMLSKLYKRTETTITCRLSGKTHIIRKGDWFLKKDGKWKGLRNPRELKDFLGYALKGELFIFDGIEDKDGVSYCKGHYFNDERTQVLKVDVPLGDNATRGRRIKNKVKINPRLLPKMDEGAS